MNARPPRSTIPRRPLQARQSRWAHAASAALLRLGLRPNGVSIVSIAFAALAAASLIFSAKVDAGARAVLLGLAAASIQLRLLCNLLDGLMAVEGGLRSKCGEIFNDFPDRISDALILIAAGYAAPSIPHAHELGWLAALLATLTSYVRVLGASAGAPHDFRGPMAKPHRMAVLTAACLLAAAEPLFDLNDHTLAAALAIISLGCVITFLRRLRFTLRDLESKT
ncbi:MAG: CDP-alcohol phosphatidyltransferase family protein [Phycisphaerales bacterium]|nr:CDP-alcohol phosphatidyltransferase family protein [Phycisphaerales bacterium]MCI0677273.1 CDP-alcohol phosphatidyltransferase family protein [Phycisphaerales bacterium]